MPGDKKGDLGLSEEKVAKFKAGMPKPQISETLKKLGGDVLDFLTPRSHAEKAADMKKKAEEDRKKRKPNRYERAGKDQGDSGSL
jgi:hypothetical protein